MDNRDPFLLAEWLVRYKAGQLSEQEQYQVETWIREDPRIRELADQLDDRRQTSEALHLLASFDPEAAMAKAPLRSSGSYRLVRRTLMAAAVVLVTLVGGLLLRPGGNDTPGIETRPKEPVRLKTASGRELILDTLEEAVVETLLGQRTDDLPGRGTDQVPGTTPNELIVPARNQYKVMLQDQSVVYLNAGSVLRFPSVFTATERRVSLVGEGYFEIAADAGRPFVVETDNMQVNTRRKRWYGLRW